MVTIKLLEDALTIDIEKAEASVQEDKVKSSRAYLDLLRDLDLTTQEMVSLRK